MPSTVPDTGWVLRRCMLNLWTCVSLVVNLPYCLGCSFFLNFLAYKCLVKCIPQGFSVASYRNLSNRSFNNKVEINSCKQFRKYKVAHALGTARSRDSHSLPHPFLYVHFILASVHGWPLLSVLPCVSMSWGTGALPLSGQSLAALSSWDEDSFFLASIE